METPIAAASVHVERPGGEPLETLCGAVLATFHRPDDAGERVELLLLATHQRVSFEEGDHPFQEIPAPSNYQHHCLVVRATVVLTYRSAADPLPDQVEDLGPDNVLADSEFRHELPTDTRARIPLDRHVEAAFSIDETRDVRVQPFLLIVRT